MKRIAAVLLCFVLVVIVLANAYVIETDDENSDVSVSLFPPSILILIYGSFIEHTAGYDGM
jgi:hypothetical protein